MAQKTYKTRQREEILSLFEMHPNRCFSAREIIAEGSLSAAQATVYRTLALLADEGVITRFHGDSGDCYRLACKVSHIHFVCNTCGELIHADCEFISEISRHLTEHHGFTLDAGSTVIRGRCAKCANS